MTGWRVCPYCTRPAPLRARLGLFINRHAPWGNNRLRWRCAEWALDYCLACNGRHYLRERR